jgi:hypothetical protein
MLERFSILSTFSFCTGFMCAAHLSSGWSWLEASEDCRSVTWRHYSLPWVCTEVWNQWSRAKLKLILGGEANGQMLTGQDRKKRGIFFSYFYIFKMCFAIK